ncbi:MAG: hypothetical protein EOS73_24705 [Mesorhizobium sp.]|uniref:hypothetical protein n=1 Tax=Mesorhizobium sp. M7A.F.Ca.ET.027.02.1.1 TaxID=2496655 RepID=UPI000FD1A405|nr:hypothetical protein [Mesorhizobium sp. M7A.F.Ca.ET.027.02.1.1]RVD14621.1 hypothetical protein EN749_19015 [Mesorhizobium sp. M7A.F.Ca.ET.027.02.1.1]RWD00986.1 MAG: hypothetical protein EOS73_24705 [Mesorhizobium sp.]
MRGVHQITPTLRVVETDREWIVQAVETKRTRRRGTQSTGEWTDRAYLTTRTMLNGELKRLVGNGAMTSGLVGHVSQEVLDWLDSLPDRHPSREVPTVLDMLEASTAGSEHGETFHDHLPLIVKHGPLRWRNDRNARFDP